MEVHHKPKAWHGWREFLREYLIILVAVLTAAFVTEIVEGLRWAERTRHTKEHLRAELRLIAGDAQAVLTNNMCALVMDDRLEQALTKSGDVWRPPFVMTVSYGGFTSTTPAGRWTLPDPKAVTANVFGRWDTQAWRNAQADGTANHMSEKDNMAFGRMYEVVGRARALTERLEADSDALAALALPQQLDAASRSEYLKAIARLRWGLTRELAYSAEILQRADALNIVRPGLADKFDLASGLSICRQFQAGKTDLVSTFPKAALPLPPE